MRRWIVAIAVFAFWSFANAQTMKSPDITQTPTLYVVPYAHLDTQWRWEFPQTISEYLLKTMRANFDLFKKYPNYVFNFTGANRYRLMKEYFPSDYALVKQYVAAGRWFPAGSSMEESDVNIPSAEGLFREILYGNTYFRKEFGQASTECMLPDSFGFPASFPSILAHAGIKGFSTQKLSSWWQPASRVGGGGSIEHTPEGIPFNVGIWEGPDGEGVVAALNPGTFDDLHTDVGGDSYWINRVKRDGEVSGVYADYRYVGTGDTGGALSEASVKLLETIVTRGAAVVPDAARGPWAQILHPFSWPSSSDPVGGGRVHLVIATADQMFNDIKPKMADRLPRYHGDLELINHSAGSLTSEAYHKRWNHKDEVLAAAAEKSALAAEWLGGRPYPQERLNNAWALVLGGHFHDTAAGTATPRSYQLAWNDDAIAMNQFAGVLTSATEAIASGLNTKVPGTAVVVYNPLNIAREDVVEAKVPLPPETKAVRVIGPDGKEVPAQLEGGKTVFVARASSVGYAVYDVEPAAIASRSTLKVTTSSLENARYRVTLDQEGDVSSIFDKSINRELLTAPVRFEILHDAPREWPAWNMDFDQVRATPRAWVCGPAKVRIVENGAARVAVEVARELERSSFVTIIRLAAGGAGNRVEFANSIDWRLLASNLKVAFSLTASNPDATYNLDIGTELRPTENARQFEVGSHQWIDLTDRSGTYGATILTDVKNGSDKYDDHTIRLTLIRTPGPWRRFDSSGRLGRLLSTMLVKSAEPQYSDQFNQDWGHHEILFGIAGHRGDWRLAQTDWEGQRLDVPLAAFVTCKHAGMLGREFSLLDIDNPRIRVLALKKAEMSNEVILRMVELDGKPASSVRIKFAGPITDAREINGQELPVGPARLRGGALVTSFGGYEPRTFALKLGTAPAKVPSVASKPVALRYDLAAASNDDTKTEYGFDDHGNALPAEMLPRDLEFHGVKFRLAPAGTGRANALVCNQQQIDLPPGRFNHVYILAAAEGDQQARFLVGANIADLTVQDWSGFIGQWDTRLWKPRPATAANSSTPLRRDWAVSANYAKWELGNPGSPNWSPRFPDDFLGMTQGYVKGSEIAWFASHHHTADGLNEPYQYSYLFAYALRLPSSARKLTLPKNPRIRILAVSVAEASPEVRAVQPLCDEAAVH